MKRSSKYYEELAKAVAAALQDKTKEELIVLAANAIVMHEQLDEFLRTDAMELARSAMEKQREIAEDVLDELQSSNKALRFNWGVIDGLHADLRQQPSKLASRGGQGKSEKQKEADRDLFAFLDRHASEKPKQLRERLKSGATFDMAHEDAKNTVRRWQRARKE